MSITAPTRPASTSAARLRFSGVLRSELLKLVSLRSTRIAAAALVLVVAGGMALRAFAYAEIGDPVLIGVPAEQAWRNVIDVGIQGGELVAVVMAVLAMSSEYTDRVALTTFAAVPRRLLLLGAKAVAALGAIAALVAAGLAIGMLVSVPLMSAARLAGPRIDTFGALLAGLCLLVIYGVFAFAAAALVRSTAAGVTLALGVLLVLPVVTELLGLLLHADLGPLLLTYAAPVSTAAIHESAGDLGPALAVTAAWLVLPGAAAALALVRRDV